MSNKMTERTGRKEFQKNFLMVGFIFYIPIVLVAGPLIGYLAGDFLNEQFKLGANIVTIFTALGFVSSVMEVVKIIKRMIRMDKTAGKGSK